MAEKVSFAERFNAFVFVKHLICMSFRDSFQAAIVSAGEQGAVLLRSKENLCGSSRPRRFHNHLGK